MAVSAETTFMEGEVEGEYFILGEIFQVVQSSFEQVPILLLIPLIVIASLLISMVGSIVSGVIDVKRLITYTIVILVTVAMVGVMYLV